VADPDDNVLVSLVTGGDRSAFRTLVERHQARVFYLGVKFLRNLQDAEDFAQEVFLKAFRKLESFHGQVPFGAWLYRLAFNLAVNEYHVSRRKLTEVDTDQVPMGGRELSPEEASLRQETRDEVRQALDKLPDAYQLVIRMHFYDGMSYPEISRAAGIPVNTIKSHVFRAKRIIRSQLARGAPEPQQKKEVFH
jgi:RNA polymerase sigma-70 factor (ECF subfamily)